MSLTYFSDFESVTTGELPSGWTNIGSADYQVGTNSPVYGSKSFGPAAYTSGEIAVNTGFTAKADMAAQISQKVLLNGSNEGTNCGVAIRCDATADNGYFILPNLNTGGVIYIFRRVGGTFTNVNATGHGLTLANGDTVHIKAEASGTTIRWKAWKSGTAEPSGWTKSLTDGNITAAGYMALYAGTNAGSETTPGPPAVDAVYVGGVGDTFPTDRVAIDNASVAAGLSPYNWLTSGSSYIQSVNPGAYVNLGFTGTSIAALVDVSAISGAAVSAGSYPRVRYRIDAGPWTTTHLTSASELILLGSGLSDASHTLTLYYLASDAYTARWNGTMSLKITGFAVGTTKSVSAATLRAKRLIAFGDSITEGAWVDGPPTDLANYSLYGDSTDSYIRSIAEELGAEYGSCAFGGQAWSAIFNSDVPAFPDAWDFYFGSNSRLTNGALTPAPDYLICNEGANGGLSSASTLTAWMVDARAAVGASCQIFIVVPFGQAGKTNITTGFNDYVSAHPSDTKVHLIDLGALDGITSSSGSATFRATDGLHPDPQGHAAIGALLADRIRQAFMPAVGAVSLGTQFNDGTSGAAVLTQADVQTAMATGSVASVTGDVGGNVTGSVNSVTTGVTVTTNNDKTGYGLEDGAITGPKIGTGAMNGKGDWNTVAPLNAAGVRGAIGLATANLDTQLGGIATSASSAATSAASAATSAENTYSLANGSNGFVAINSAVAGVTVPDLAAIWSYPGRSLDDQRIILVPAVQKGHRELVRGDAYGPGLRAFDIIQKTGAEWPEDLNDYEWVCVLTKAEANEQDGTPSLEAPVTVEDVSEGVQVAHVALTSEESAAMAPGDYTYQVVGTNDDEQKWTLELGTISWV